MATLWQDIRYGIRMLVKNRGVTIFAAFALAIGIGANSTIFSMANSILLSPWPFSNPERIVRIGEVRTGRELGNLTLSGLNFLEWKGRCQSFEAVSLMTIYFFNLTGEDLVPEEVAAYLWSPNVTDVFQALNRGGLGRWFLPEEDQPGKEHVVVLSHGIWNERFGTDPDILGKPVYLNGEAYTVIGVLPASSSVLEAQARLWLPLPTETVREGKRSDRSYGAFALLKPGVSMEQAQAEMTVISENLAQEFEENEKWQIVVVPAIENLVHAMKQTLIVLHGAVGFVLLIACLNVASLLLARGATRQKEISIRIAVGANRVRVVRQMLTESMLLSMCGGFLGLLLTVGGIGILKILLPPVLVDYVTRQGIDIRLLGFTLAVSILTGLLFGIVPAFRASKLNLSEMLKGGGSAANSRSAGHRSLRILVVAEIALSLMLLLGAGLMIKSFVRLQSVDPGFRSENLMTLHVTLRGSKYEEDHQKRSFYRDVIPRIEQIPGVQSLAAASVLPMHWGVSVRFEVNGQSKEFDGEPYVAELRSIHPDYFDGLGIPLLKGRYFTPQEDREESFRIIVNESLAKRIWPAQDPIGKVLTVPKWGATSYEVVGLVGNVKHFGLNSDPNPTIYVPFLDKPAPTLSLAIRTSGNPLNLLPPVRETIWSRDSGLPIIRPRRMEEAIAASVEMNRFGMVLLSVFAAVSLVLSAIGIYGIMAYSVSQRTYEIGIRMALGAQIKDVIKLVVRQGFLITLIGVGIGVGGAIALMRVISSLLTTGVNATDPATFVCSTLLLIGVSLAACYIPARRAAKVDPMVTLRNE